ncbi:MAG: hypothetical protein KGI89_15980 [Euryarchaeota archaeon]|nr:hypothetical protein [Euryarchaeota archaeon]
MTELPPEWTYREAAPPLPRGSPYRFLWGVVLLVSVGAVLLFGLVASLWLFATPVRCDCPITSAVTMTATVEWTCDGATAYNITIGGTTRSLTTANLGLALTEPGSTSATPAGTAGMRGESACGVVPPTSGWTALLIAPGGAAQLAYFDAAGWHQWNATPSDYPTILTGGETLVVLASGHVQLVQATISIYGTNGSLVTGSVTL